MTPNAHLSGIVAHPNHITINASSPAQRSPATDIPILAHSLHTHTCPQGDFEPKWNEYQARMAFHLRVLGRRLPSENCLRGRLEAMRVEGSWSMMVRGEHRRVLVGDRSRGTLES